MTDFPDIDMSIGEYYKMLLENKRPTRRAASKEEPPKPPIQPAQIVAKPKKVEKQQELIKPQKGAQISSHKEEKLNKRKDKALDKQKMKEQKSEIFNFEEVKKIPKKQTLNVREEGRLRQSTSAQAHEYKHKNFKPEKKQKSSFNEDVQMAEDSDGNVKAEPQSLFLEKFETLEPHPLYSSGRFVFNKEDGRVLQLVKAEEQYFEVILQNKSHQIEFQKISYLGKPYLIKASLINQISEEILKSYFQKDHQNQSIIIVQHINPTNKDLKQIQFVALLANEQVIEVHLNEDVKLENELKEFDEGILNHDSYKENLKESLIQLCKQMSLQFDKYQQEIKQIILTKSNMNDFLFSICSYEASSESQNINIQNDQIVKLSQKVKQGILLQIKFDKYYNDYMLLMRLLNVKHAYKKKVEWLELNKFSIVVDQSQGYISLSRIQTFQNTIGANQKLKSNQLTKVSYRDSLKQKQQIQISSDFVCDSSHIRKQILVKGLENERCQVCNYITKDIEHVKCSGCSQVYHLQCLKNPWQAGLGQRETEWRCQDCIRCTNCLSQSNNTQLYICIECNSAFHEDCLDTSSKLSIPNQPEKDSPNKVGKQKTKSLSQLDFKCDKCAKCEHCGAKEAGANRLNKWSKDFKLCSLCNKRKKNKQYCLACEKFWPEVEVNKNEQEEFKTSEDANKQYLQSQMVNCQDCLMWVHLDCDRIFQDQSLKEKFDSGLYNYSCFKCRQQRRMEGIKQLIDTICGEDKSYFFQEPVEDQVANYTKIVKMPMCFKYVKEKLNSSKLYLLSPEQLKQDIQLIFQNAILFNLPKHRVHKEAQKLLDQFQMLFQNAWPALEKQKLRTIDEDAYQQILSQQKKQQCEGGQLSEPKYLLSAQEAFDSSEFQHFNKPPIESQEKNEQEDEIMEDGENQTSAAVNLKNLRQRKHINYNEDKNLELAGVKRKHEDEQKFNLKRIKTDDIYIPKGPTPLETLTLAINQQQQQQNQNASNASIEEVPKDHVAQQQQMMMNYYEGIDDEKCYYSNPSRCSFDNPALLFEEMCYLCGAFGNRQDFLCCTLCGESFHTYCLSLPHDNIAKFQPYWKCLNCKYCEVCSQATQEAQLLYCDICDKAFHSFCLKPKLKSIPNCQWKCQECFSCQKCGTKTFFNEEDSAQLKNLEVTDFRFSANFSFCYGCGLNEYKKSFCKICTQKTESNDQNNSALDKMQQCTSCGFYSHLRCSRLLPDDLGEEVEEYKCLECLLSGKTINHLIRETCEHYENLHQIISRQKLLTAICQESLSKYIPMPEKAPLFIKAFIDQNQQFFREDPIIQNWLYLIETNVCFEQTQAQTPKNETDVKEDQEMKIESEENKVEEKQDQNVLNIQDQVQKKNFENDWSGINIESAMNTQKQLCVVEKDNQELESEMFSHKQSFLPKKRNLYKSLKDNDIHRFAQRDKFIPINEMEKLITVPTDEVLSKVNFAEEYVAVEFKGLIRLKCQFFQWFEDMIKSILKKNQRFIRKEKKFSSSKHSEDSQNIPIQNNEVQEDPSRDDQNQEDDIMQIEDGFMTIQDAQVDNPQNKLQCVMCKLWGEMKVSGRLIPFQVNQFVHVNCALWSTEVYENDDGQLVNFFFIQSARNKKCVVCNESGASILCFGRKCHQAFHFPCAYSSGRVAFMRSKETFCDQCSRQKGIVPGYLSEFNVPRRLYIVRNQQPWNMSSALTQQPMNQLGGEGDKPFTIEKWRPFYYDMFNRVGNLTVLSLKQNVNQIIDEISQTGTKVITPQDSIQVQDFATVRIYWKFYKDSDMKQEDENINDPLALKKGYFIYSNNLIKEIKKDDMQSLIPLLGDKLKERVLHLQQKGIYHPLKAVQSSTVLIDQIISASKNITVDHSDFWTKIINHFQRKRPNFTLSNIEFSIFEFTGKTKYPVSIWNRAETKNKHFFLKSGAQVLASQAFSERDNINSQNVSKVIQGFDFQIEGHMSIDDIFRQMAQINQVGDGKDPHNQNGKRFVSSKHMKYGTMLKILGKKMFFQKPEPLQGGKHEQKPNKNLRTTESIDNTVIYQTLKIQNKEIDLPIAMKYRMSKSQPKRVEVGPSKIHRNGLFTLEEQIDFQLYSLMVGDMVIEYVGEKIRNSVADKREIVYEQKGIGDCYLFRLDKEYIIDATFFGNKARYLNHSCDANCSAKIITVQGQQHIIISANRPIKSGEELTYNYNFDMEADKLECYCGSQNCSGRLN